MNLHSFHNANGNTTIFVSKISYGFSVTMRDDDSGEYFPSAMIYPTEAKALAKAHELAAS
jgi:hypothetical protein